MNKMNVYSDEDKHLLHQRITSEQEKEILHDALPKGSSSVPRKM